MATTFFPVYQHARPAARRFIALRGMPFFVAPSNTRYRRHFYLKFRPPPPRLIAAGTKKRTPRIRNYYYKFIFFSFQFFHFWKNSSIIETKTRIFEFPSSRRRIFKFLKKIRIPSRLKISIKLRLFFTLIELLQYIYVHRWLFLVKRSNEVEYHHLPGSRQADSSRRLLALIVSRHAARARHPPPHHTAVTPLLLPSHFSQACCLPSWVCPTTSANGATNFRLRVGISSGTLDPIACAYPLVTRRQPQVELVGNLRGRG